MTQKEFDNIKYKYLREHKHDMIDKFNLIQLVSALVPNAVDYIKVPLGSNSDLSSEIPEAYIAGSKYSYVPTLSTINVTVAPAYSRTATREFDLQSFIKGDYIGNTKPGGFI